MRLGPDVEADPLFDEGTCVDVLFSTHVFCVEDC
jgi:hypothetical protein